MIQVKAYKKEYYDIWNDFIRKSKCPMFMFNRDFIEYHSDRFKDASLMFFRDDDLIGVLPASVHGSELRSHGGLTYGGLLASDDMKQHTMLECFEALKVYLESNGIISLVYKTVPYIYYLKPNQEDVYALFRFGATLHDVSSSTVIDLQNPCRMTKGRKSQISRARREGVEVVETKNFTDFLELENRVLFERHNTFAVHTDIELEQLHKKFSHNIILLCGYYKEKMIAGALLFVYETVVHTQYLAADEKAREIGALDLVISECIKKSVKLGVRYFDFGTSQDPRGGGINAGLKSQKEGFGGRTVVQSVWKVQIRGNNI